jgi:hypothetical protein
VVGSNEEVMETNAGYLVFDSNHCGTFRGTLTCDALQWDNVKILGYRVKPQARRTIELDESCALWRNNRWP